MPERPLERLARLLSENNLNLIPRLRDESATWTSERWQAHLLDAQRNAERCVAITAPIVALPGDPRVLEIGLGLGHVTTTLRTRLGDRGSLSALEHPDSARLGNPYLDQHLRQVGVEQLETADLRTDPLPWPDESFDVVVMAEVIEHIPYTDAIEVLSKIRALIKRGGLLVIASENLYGLVSRIRFVAGRGPLFQPPDKEGGSYGHVALYGKSEILELLVRAGFRCRDFRFYNWAYHYIPQRLPRLLQQHLPKLIPSLGTSWYATAGPFAEPRERRTTGGRGCGR